MLFFAGILGLMAGATVFVALDPTTDDIDDETGTEPETAAVDEDGNSGAQIQIDTGPVAAPDEPPDSVVARHGGAGNDILSGGDDIDEIHGGAGNDQINGYGGNDTLSGAAGRDALYGNDGDDSLSGGDDADLLHGESGADTLAGDAGNDTLFGHLDDDILSGGEGADSLVGGSGDDVLQGNAGDDALHGGHDDDRLEGGAGQDTLFGGFGNDLVHGLGAQAGGEDSDYLNGGTGNDTLIGGRGDVLTGGDGADDFLLAQWDQPGDVLTVMDFDPDEDNLLLLYEDLGSDPDILVEPDANALGSVRVLVNGSELAVIHNGAGLTAADITLLPQGSPGAVELLRL